MTPGSPLRRFTPPHRNPALECGEGGDSPKPRALARGAGFNVAAGNFFFRVRNGLFPMLFFLGALIVRPHVILDNPALDRLLIACGVVIALAGQAVRLTTIGFEYIERGGKEGKVYASRLVQGGVYGISRNPMYVGNALIAIGVSMTLGAPVAYVIIIPFFLWVYHAIVAAEEAYLHGRFGAEYDDYCARVPRFLPALRNATRAFAGMRYNWKVSVRKELSTMTGLLCGLTALPLWRIFWLQGWDAASAAAPRTITLLAVILALYALLAHLKRRRLLFY